MGRQPKKVIKKPQVEIQGVKNTVFELENALDGTSSRSHTSRENEDITIYRKLFKMKNKEKRETKESNKNQGPESQHQAI